MDDKICANCKYYAEFECVCCNGDSEYGADFIDSKDTCNFFSKESE